MILKKKISRLFKGGLFVLLILSSNLGFSQERMQQLGDFDELKVFSGLSVEIERSDEAKIQITGEDTDDVVVKNVNGRLKISLKFPESFNADKVKVKIFYNQDISLLDSNEGSAIYSEATVKQKKLAVRTQEGAYMHIPVKVNFLVVKAVTGGAVRLRGKALNQEVEVTTGGIYEGYELLTETADITSSSGSTAEVTVSKQLDAKVRFGGRISYKGNPEKVNSKKIIGGSIKNKG